jgi:hypothetical protein
MSNRINQLIEECTSVYDDIIYDGRDTRWKTTEYFDKQKFAELIVKECMEVGGPEDSYRDEWFNAKVDSVAKIKQHFGVEE